MFSSWFLCGAECTLTCRGPPSDSPGAPCGGSAWAVGCPFDTALLRLFERSEYALNSDLFKRLGSYEAEVPRSPHFRSLPPRADPFLEMCVCLPLPLLPGPQGRAWYCPMSHWCGLLLRFAFSLFSFLCEGQSLVKEITVRGDWGVPCFPRGHSLPSGCACSRPAPSPHLSPRGGVTENRHLFVPQTPIFKIYYP